VLNARLLAELGADPQGRDGHGMTPLDYCGGGSAVGRAIKEGVAVRDVRALVRRLFLASSVAVAVGLGTTAADADADAGAGAGGAGGAELPLSNPASSSSSSSSSSFSFSCTEEEGHAARVLPHGGKSNGDDGGGGGGSKRRRKGEAGACLAWREARRQRGRPLPVVTFAGWEGDVVGGGGGGGGGGGVGVKKVAAVRELARLLRGVFVHMPLDVRRQIVAFV
jgi:hypothetical protein